MNCHTLNGKCFKPGAITAADVDIRDIAVRLSRIHRFGGDSPLTVAHHSLAAFALAHRLYPAAGRVQVAALIHDLHEAYVGDVVTPLKRELGPEFEKVDHAARVAVADHLDVPHWGPEWDLVREVDELLMHMEAGYVYSPLPAWVELDKIPKALVTGIPDFLGVIMSPTEAQIVLLEALERLQNGTLPLGDWGR